MTQLGTLVLIVINLYTKGQLDQECTLGLAQGNSTAQTAHSALIYSEKEKNAMQVAKTFLYNLFTPCIVILSFLFEKFSKALGDHLFEEGHLGHLVGNQYLQAIARRLNV